MHTAGAAMRRMCTTASRAGGTTSPVRSLAGSPGLLTDESRYFIHETNNLRGGVMEEQKINAWRILQRRRREWADTVLLSNVDREIARLRLVVANDQLIALGVKTCRSK